MELEAEKKRKMSPAQISRKIVSLCSCLFDQDGGRLCVAAWMRNADQGKSPKSRIGVKNQNGL